jgi:hypothetical protein
MRWTEFAFWAAIGFIVALALIKLFNIPSWIP